MELKNSHGGNEGLSISDKIQHKLDDKVKEQADHIATGHCAAGSCPISNERRGEINALAWVLSLMRNTDTETEKHDSRMRHAGKTDGVVGGSVDPVTEAFSGPFPGDDEEGAG